MPKYKDALYILKRRIEFFRGDVYEAGGKELMYRVMASEPELEMLEYIENQYEPTTYEYKPGHHVDFITPEICLFVRLIYTKLKQSNGETGTQAGAQAGTQTGQETGKNRGAPGGGQPARKRHKAGDAGGNGDAES